MEIDAHHAVTSGGSAIDGEGPASRPDVSVVIVNWNGAAYLPAALQALATAGGGLAMEVWVVDNASTDGSLGLLRQDFSWVQVLANDVNQGFAAANNQGIARSKGRYLLLLNPDTEMPADSLRRLVAYLDQHPEVGVAGPHLIGQRGKTQGGAAGYDPSPHTIFNYATFLYRLFPQRFRGLWLPQAAYERGQPLRVDWVSGACLLARREAAVAAGPLDERYFMYSEDVEWCRRIRRAGYVVVCDPAVSVIHHIGGSTRQRGAAFHALNIDSLDQDLRSRYGAPSVALMHLIGAFGFLLRFLIYELLWLRWRLPVFAELRDLWLVCLQTSLQRIVRPAEQRLVTTDR